MATGKKSFLLYADFATIFYELTDNEAGQLIKHVFKYVNDENPIIEDRLLKLVFEPIKQQLKRDLIQWESIKEKRSEAGKASAEAKRVAKQKLTKSTHVKSVQQNQQGSTKSTVNVNDNVNVINIVDVAFTDFLNMRKKIKKPATDRAVIMLKKNLEELSGGNDELKVKLIERAILKNWLEFYPLDNGTSKHINSNIAEANPEDF